MCSHNVSPNSRNKIEIPYKNKKENGRSSALWGVNQSQSFDLTPGTSDLRQKQKQKYSSVLGHYDSNFEMRNNSVIGNKKGHFENKRLSCIQIQQLQDFRLSKPKHKRRRVIGFYNKTNARQQSIKKWINFHKLFLRYTGAHDIQWSQIVHDLN